MSSAQVTFQSGQPQTPPSVRYGALADPSPAELSAEGLTDDSPSNRSVSSGPSPVRDEESNAPSGTLSLPCTPPRSGEVTPVMKPCHSAPNTPLPVQLKFEDEERTTTQPPSNLPEVSTPEPGTPSASDILMPVSPEEQRHHNMKKKKYHSAAANPGQTRPRPFNPQTTYQPPKVAQIPDTGLATAAGTDPRKYKTKMCRNFVMGTPCNYGTRCSFAHGVHEMRDQSHNAMPTIIGGTPIMPNAMPQVSYTYPVVIPQTLAAPQQALQPVQQVGQQMVMPVQANGMAMQAVDANAAGTGGAQTVMVPVMMQPMDGTQNAAAAPAMVPQTFPAQQGIQYVVMSEAGQPQLAMGNMWNPDQQVQQTIQQPQQ